MSKRRNFLIESMVSGGNVHILFYGAATAIEAMCCCGSLYSNLHFLIVRF